MSTEYEAQKVHAQRMRELRDAPDLAVQRAVALLLLAALVLAPALLALVMQWLAPFDS